MGIQEECFGDGDFGEEPAVSASPGGISQKAMAAYRRSPTDFCQESDGCEDFGFQHEEKLRQCAEPGDLTIETLVYLQWRSFSRGFRAGQREPVSRWNQLWE